MNHLVKISVFMILFLISFTFINSAELKIKTNNEDDQYLSFAEEMPSPVGGLKAIYKNINYPSLAKKAGLEGKVFLLTYINENGDVTEIKVVKGIGGGCDAAAVKAIKKIKFRPGKNKGKPVRVKLSLTINFKLK